MKIFSLLLFLLLLPLLATRGGQSTYPAPGPGRQAYGATPAAPTAPHAACFTMGAATTYTTGSVNTTGSNTIVAIVSYFNLGTIATVVDNGTSTTLTTPLSTTIATSQMRCRFRTSFPRAAPARRRPSPSRQQLPVRCMAMCASFLSSD